MNFIIKSVDFLRKRISIWSCEFSVWGNHPVAVKDDTILTFKLNPDCMANMITLIERGGWADYAEMTQKAFETLDTISSCQDNGGKVMLQWPSGAQELLKSVLVEDEDVAQDA